MPVPEKSKMMLAGVLVLVSASCYAAIGYALPRSAFATFIGLAGIAFIAYGFLVSNTFNPRFFTGLLVSSFGLRLIFLPAVPVQSDDYARFLWDGVLSNEGINVYAYTPAALHQVNHSPLPAFMEMLKAGMNSASYYSVYPPVLQAIFFFSVKLGGLHLGYDLAWYRLFALVAEGGTIFVVMKLLQRLELPRERVLWWALNPLVIIEFAGNLHGEVFMIFFASLCLWFLTTEKMLWSAVALGLATSTKLMPLVLLPAIISYVGLRKGTIYGFIAAITVAASFFPYLDAPVFTNIGRSVGLYFDRFEFNASIYYLLLWVGYDVTGVNIIYVLGKLMSIASVLLILWFNLRNSTSELKELFVKMVTTVLLYYLFSLVVHPWYITVLVFLSMFSRYRFAYAWSALVLLTYSAYTQAPYKEVLWLTAVEYVLVVGFAVFEYRSFQRASNVILHKRSPLK